MQENSENVKIKNVEIFIESNEIECHFKTIYFAVTNGNKFCKRKPRTAIHATNEYKNA